MKMPVRVRTIKQKISTTYLTRVDINTWILEIGGLSILLDPWMVGAANIPFLFKVEHADKVSIKPEDLNIDAVVITHQDPDHCHIPTLKELSKDIVAIGPKKVCRIYKKLGFENIVQLNPWLDYKLKDVKIYTVPGAHPKILKQNGYVFESGKSSVYFGGDTFLIPELKEIEGRFKIDTAIIPMEAVVFPFVGQIIMGPKEALELVKIIKPKKVIPTSHGNVKFSGPLGKVIKTIGSVEEFVKLVNKKMPRMEIIKPDRGERITI